MRAARRGRIARSQRLQVADPCDMSILEVIPWCAKAVFYEAELVVDQWSDASGTLHCGHFAPLTPHFIRHASMRQLSLGRHHRVWPQPQTTHANVSSLSRSYWPLKFLCCRSAGNACVATRSSTVRGVPSPGRMNAICTLLPSPRCSSSRRRSHTVFTARSSSL
jgi:hypothetical protein